MKITVFFGFVFAIFVAQQVFLYKQAVAETFNPTQYMLNQGLPTQQVHQCFLTPNGSGGYIQRCF